MPTYEYQCQACSHGFEISQKITDPPIEACPVCRGRAKRLISTGIGFILKGSAGCSAPARMKNACGIDPGRCGEVPLCGCRPGHEG